MLLKMPVGEATVKFGCKVGIGYPAITGGDGKDIRVQALCQSGAPYMVVTFPSPPHPNHTSSSSYLQGARYGIPEVRRMSDYSPDTMAFLDMQEAGSGDDGVLLPCFGAITIPSEVGESCNVANIEEAVETGNATLVALEAHIQSMGFSLDRLFITNYWMSKQYTFFADLNSWLTGSNTQLGQQIARVEEWILSMYQSLAFQLEYKTMMAKISVGNEFTEITGMKLKKKSGKKWRDARHKRSYNSIQPLKIDIWKFGVKMAHSDNKNIIKM